MAGKIAVISRNWFPSVYGGAEKFISRLAEYLYKKGFDVIGITKYVKGFAKPEANHRLVYYCEKRHIPIVSSFKFSLWAAKVVNDIKPAVVIVNSYWGEASPIFIEKCTPIILIIHDVGLFKSEYAKRHRLGYLLRVHVLKKITRRAELIVVPSDAVKNDIVRYLGVEPQKIFVLGFEGVDGPFKREHIENEYFDIVHVGRFAPNKGHFISLKAVKEVIKDIPNVRLWLVGGKGLKPEHEDYLEYVRRVAQEINREIGREVIKIVVNAPEIDVYYKIADICIAPSLGEEGFGLSVVECMSYGKPIIASDVFQETGVASPERCLIFKRGDYRELSKHILTLYRNKDVYNRLSKAGLEYARYHSWNKVAGLFAEFIDRVKEMHC